MYIYIYIYIYTYRKGEYLVVTKGDNNEVDDRSLWAHKKLGETKFFLKSRYIQGRIRA